MAEENTQRGSIYSANDPLDINELASLNDDISPEFIEQLQNQLTQQNSGILNSSESKNENENLFEEVQTAQTEQETESSNKEESIPSKQAVNIDNNIDDNFIKKYKAKLNKQYDKDSELNSNETESRVKEESPQNAGKIDNRPIENLTSGNIVEKPAQENQIKYNDSLDYLDDNIKYSKYVIYIDPENTDFIESLTVKERKNLINKILREQDDIAITKKRLNMIQAIIKHSIIAIITIAISIPVIYFTVNTSLEASINNYRRSKTIFKTLYREKGKIKHNINY